MFHHEYLLKVFCVSVLFRVIENNIFILDFHSYKFECAIVFSILSGNQLKNCLPFCCTQLFDPLPQHIFTFLPTFVFSLSNDHPRLLP